MTESGLRHLWADAGGDASCIIMLVLGRQTQEDY